MNCLFLARYAQMGGGELRLLEEVKALRSRGHLVTILLLTEPGPLSKILVLNGFEVLHLSLIYHPGVSGTLRFLSYSTKEIVKAIIKYRIDKVVAFHIEALIVSGIASRLTGKSLIFRSAGELFIPGPIERSTWLGSKIVSYLKLVRPYILPHSNWQKALWNRFGLRSTVCCAGVRLQKDTDWNQEPEFPTLTFIGRLSAIKGPDVFLQAVLLLKQRGYKFRALLVGDQSFDLCYNNTDSKFMRTLNDLLLLPELAEFVENTGFVDDIKAVFRRSTIYISSSRAEMTGNATMEAMACGVPVVATRTLGSSEIINDGQNGFLVPIDDPASLANAIALLLDNPELRYRFRTTANEDAQKRFSAKVNLINLCEAIEQC